MVGSGFGREDSPPNLSPPPPPTLQPTKKKREKKMYAILNGSLLFQVKAHPCVAAHMLFDLEDVKKTTSTEPTLLLIDIAGYAVYCYHMLNNVSGFHSCCLGYPSWEYGTALNGFMLFPLKIRSHVNPKQFYENQKRELYQQNAFHMTIVTSS